MFLTMFTGTLPSIADMRTGYEWDSRAGNREEVWLDDFGRPYVYGSGSGVRSYTAQRFGDDVRAVMNTLNSTGDTYDVCVLNYYKDKRCGIGWHSDDSPEMDNDHPIAVLSLGGVRYIDVRRIGSRNDSERFILEEGSLFVMEAGEQLAYEHRIPKYDKETNPRLSMTFRKYS